MTSTVSTLVEYDFALGHTPENVALLADGTVCTSLLLAGAIWRSTSGVEKPVSEGGHALALGLAVDGHDRLYVAMRSQDPDIAGIWRHDGRGWARHALAHTDDGLNGITFGPDGTLFAADSVNGRILHLPAGAHELRLWLDHEALRPTGTEDPVLSTGANGVKIHDEYLYVSNSARGAIYRVEIHNGAPGAVAEYLDGYPVDDFAFDAMGVLYLAVHPDNRVVRVEPDMSVKELASAAAGIDGPSAIAVVSDGLLVTNLGLLGERHRPSLMRIECEVAAAALPQPMID